MKNHIITTTKNVYGNDLTYPVCETAKTFTKMLGRKTLTRDDLIYIRELGYLLLDALDVQVLGIEACLEKAAQK